MTLKVTDGLEHYGEIQVKGDINYLHGYMLGKKVNRLGDGFYGAGEIYRRHDGFETYQQTQNLRYSAKNLGISPFYGVFYGISSGTIRVLDKNANPIAQHTVPDVSTDLRAQGLATIDGKGNGLIVTDRKFYHLNSDGTIRNEANHNFVGTTAYASEWQWVCVNPKKDIFAFCVFSGIWYFAICRLSTLQILNNNLTGGTPDIRFYFLKNNKMVVASENNNSSFRVIDIDYDNFTTANTTNFTLPHSVAWRFLGVNKKGFLMFHSTNRREVIEVSPEDGSYSTVVSGLGVNVSFSDFDEKYLYGASAGELGGIDRIHVYDIKTGQLVKTAYRGGSMPFQFKGKMPITEAFF